MEIPTEAIASRIQGSIFSTILNQLVAKIMVQNRVEYTYLNLKFLLVLYKVNAVEGFFF